MNPMQQILDKIQEAGLVCISHREKYLFLEDGYCIEIENPNLFKLSHENHVIAPFDDLSEMLNFIQMDKELNAES